MVDLFKSLNLSKVILGRINEIALAVIALTAMTLTMTSSAQASLVMVSSVEDGVKGAKVILLVKVKNKNVHPKYKKVDGKKQLASTNLEVFGSVKSVILGEYKAKTFNGSFKWQNLMTYDQDGKEAGTMVVESLESGEEGTLEEGQEWIIYLGKPAPKIAKAPLPFFRAENSGVLERILSITCKKSVLKNKMPQKGKELCSGIKLNNESK